ncbi:MAG: hypothetical protein ACYSVY_26760, partial [Planctomycetota bacterium]|jgi:hypothetical protein
METKEWERIVRNRRILRKIEDIEGKTIYTDELLFTYLEQFEKDIAACSARVIDATEGGAWIRGTEVMSLHEALERHCRGDIPAERFEYLETARWYDPARLPAARAEIALRLDEVRAVERICQELIEVLGELQGLTEDPARFNRRLVWVDELRAQVQQHDRAYRIINSATQRAELRRFAADRKLELDEASGGKRAAKQLQRDLDFVAETKEGAADVIGILTETLARLDKAIAQGSRT